MPKYMLIESRDPFESNDVSYYYGLAADLRSAGNDVTLFLVQNGVFPARSGARSGELQRIVEAGVEVLADAFSLRERGIDPAALVHGVAAAPLDIVVDGLAAGHKVLWH